MHAHYVHLTLFFHDPSPPQIYTLSLHDALPISWKEPSSVIGVFSSACMSLIRSTASPSATPGARLNESVTAGNWPWWLTVSGDRKSTRLNSSHPSSSYAVFCLKKKKEDKAHAIT